MEEPVRHRHYNSALQAYSNVHKANAPECQNWLMAMLHYSMLHCMTEVAQMAALAVDPAWAIENSLMAVLQMVSMRHSLVGRIQIVKG